MAKTVAYEDVRRARETIRDRVSPTPLIRSFGLEERLGRPLWLKCELLQRTGSFKVRGALNWIRTASRDELRRGLVTISAGNHAQALAWAAREVGVPVTVVMPEDSSPMKIEATRRYGAEVVLHGNVGEALKKLEELKDSRNLVLVHPFDNPRIIAGQGTVGLEILEQLPDVDTIVCPIGGGGLISGVALTAKTASPKVRVIGVEPAGAATLRHAWDRGGPHPLGPIETVAPSLGAAVAGEFTYEMTRRYVDEIVTLPEDEIVAGLRATLQDGKVYAEPGGSIGVAAILAGRISLARDERVVAVVSGGNLDIPLLQRLLQWET